MRNSDLEVKEKANITGVKAKKSLIVTNSQQSWKTTCIPVILLWQFEGCTVLSSHRVMKIRVFPQSPFKHRSANAFQSSVLKLNVLMISHRLFQIIRIFLSKLKIQPHSVYLQYNKRFQTLKHNHLIIGATMSYASQRRTSSIGNFTSRIQVWVCNSILQRNLLPDPSSLPVQGWETFVWTKWTIALLLKAKQTHAGSLVLLKSNNKRLGTYNGGKSVPHGKGSIAATVYYKRQVGENWHFQNKYLRK